MRYLLGLLGELLTAAPVVVIAWAGFNEAGPWAWLVSLQLRLFGAFYAGYTFVFCLLLGFFLSAAVYSGLRRLGLRGKPVLEPVAACLIGWWLALPSFLGTLALMALVVLGMGLWKAVPAWTAGPRTEVSAADLEAGRRPPSRWLVIRGVPKVQAPIVWTKGGGETAREVAMVSEGWRPGSPVAVCLRASGRGAALPVTATPTTVEGLVRSQGVPPLTREGLEKRALTPAADAVYLELGDTPHSVLQVWGWVVVGGAGGLALIVLIGLVHSLLFRRRQPEPPPPPPAPKPTADPWSAKTDKPEEGIRPALPDAMHPWTNDTQKMN